MRKTSVIGTILVILGVLITAVSSIIYNAYRVWQPHYTAAEGSLRTLSQYFIILGGFIIFLGVICSYRSIVGLIGGILAKRNQRRLRKRKKELMESSKKIVEYLKTDNSGSTPLRLASVLQVDHIKIEKSLNHLERLGVIEKKKVSAEEILFFYKTDDEININS